MLVRYVAKFPRFPSNAELEAEAEDDERVAAAEEDAECAAAEALVIHQHDGSYATPRLWQLRRGHLPGYQECSLCGILCLCILRGRWRLCFL